MTMKILHPLLAALLISLGGFVSAQSTLPSQSGSPVRPPADSGMAKSPDSSMKTPSDSGMVVPPPNIGPENIKTPPKNIDPQITDATKDIDRENRRKFEEKQKSSKRPNDSKTMR
jgi:hypothetical protein